MDSTILATFRGLLNEAISSGDPEPTAMVLSTASADGAVSSRAVLLKDVDERGFVFYTNTRSRKGQQLAQRPRACLLFYWKQVRQQVQVHVEGKVVAVADADADAYFATRSRASQIGAWASIQSSPMSARHDLESRIEQFTRQFDGAPVPRPPHWSGYRLGPDSIEFWHGAAHRLHERHRHEFRDGAWQHALLYP